MNPAKKRLPLFDLSVLYVLLVLFCSSARAAEEGAPWPAEIQQAFHQLRTFDYDQPRKPLRTLERFIAQATGDPKQREAIAEQKRDMLADPKTTLPARRFLCKQLRVLGTDAHVPTLVKMLDDPKTAEMARQALEAIPGDAPLQALRDALGTLKGTARIGVANSLGVRRDEKSVPPIAQLARSKDAALANAALEALGRIATPQAAEALEQLAPHAPDPLRKREALLLCAQRLAADGHREAATRIYRGMLDDQFPMSADMGMLAGLVATDPKGTSDLLLTAIRSADEPVARQAARLTHHIPGRKLTAKLAELLHNLQPSRQALLIEVLAERGDPAAAPAVAKLTDSKDEAVRVAAIRGMGRLGDAESVTRLVTLAATEGGAIQAAARQALSRLTADGADEELIAQATEGTPEVRTEAIRALAARRATKAVPTLLQVASGAEESGRVAALRALGALAGADSYGKLVQLVVRAPSPSVMQAAERAVEAVGERLKAGQRVQPVIAALKSASPAAQPALLRLLARFGGREALDAVRARLDHENATVRDAAVRALVRWPDPSAAADVLTLAREADDEKHRLLALRGYLRFAQEAKGGTRLKMLDNVRGLAKTPDAKKLLLASLAGVADAGALDVALAFLDDPPVKAEAALAVLKVGKAIVRTERKAVQTAMKTLIEKAKDEDILKQARALQETASKVPASQAQQHAALRPNAKRSAQYRKAIAKDAPKGYHLACYLDCGPDRKDSAKGGPTLRLVEGDAYAWSGGPATKEQLRYITIFFTGGQVFFEVSDLNPNKTYRLGFSWWDYDHNSRAQSVWAAAGKPFRYTKLLGTTRLPSGTAGDGPERKTVPLPRELTAKSTVRIAFRNEAKPNCVVSEIWLWESDAESEAKMPKPRPKGGTPVVILTGIEYPGHKWQQTAPVLADLLLEEPRLDVDILEDAKLEQVDKLRDYKVCVLNYMNWKTPDPPAERLAKLQKFVADGGGLVLVHFACGAFQDWEEFVKIAGRVWNPKLRGHDPRGSFTVEPTDVEHPITAGMKPFETRDELYTCLDGETPITVLATATSKVDKKDYPMVFVLTYGEGRVFHCVLGHDVRAFEAPAVGELYRRGTAWAAGLEPVAAKGKE
jgi:type 1 glutamine amidotransferase/HEAT repeat protein